MKPCRHASPPCGYARPRATGGVRRPIGFGVLSGTSRTTAIALGMGAFAVATAVYLILDMSQPYSGIFRVSPAALEQAIDVIDR